MVALIYLAIVAIASWLLQVIVIWQGARWFRAGKPTFRRALGAWGLLSLLGAAFLGLDAWMAGDEAAESQSPAASIALTFVLVAAGISLATAIVQWRMQLSPGRSALVYVASIISGLLVPLLVCRPFLLESFVATTGSMAPTLVNRHREYPCPACGRAVMGPVSQRGMDPRPTDPAGICEGCQRIWTVAELDDTGMEREILPPDRFLVDKTATPRRWDLLVFRYPEDPSTLYVKRLVGMPGESIQIKEGAVWVNGERMPPPPPVEGLQYSDAAQSGEMKPGLHFQLRPEEYFVLGDFTEASSDSRDWGPVPQANIVGVVTCRYWPLGRFAVIR